MLFIIVMVALWYFIPRVWNFIAVLIALSSGEEVPFEKYMEAFDFWFTIRHPMMTKVKRERTIHQQYQKKYHDH